MGVSIASRAAFRHLNKERRRPEQAQDGSVSLEELPAPVIRASAEMLESLLDVDTIPPASRAVLPPPSRRGLLLRRPQGKR
jgi:hypothetical protein